MLLGRLYAFHTNISFIFKLSQDCPIRHSIMSRKPSQPWLLKPHLKAVRKYGMILQQAQAYHTFEFHIQPLNDLLKSTSIASKMPQLYLSRADFFPKNGLYIPHQFPVSMIRSYHPEYTRSRPISEVKLDWAGPVLWTEMTREAPVTNLLLGGQNFEHFMSSYQSITSTKLQKYNASNKLCTYL